MAFFKTNLIFLAFNRFPLCAMVAFFCYFVKGITSTQPQVLYVADPLIPGIFMLPINEDGTLGAVVNVDSTTDPYYLAVAQTNDGQFLYETTGVPNIISWTINDSDGTLENKATAAASFFPVGVTAAQTSNGLFLYASELDTHIHFWPINVDGTLGSGTTVLDTVLTGVLTVAQTADGPFLYAGETGFFSTSIYSWKINANGSLGPQSTVATNRLLNLGLAVAETSSGLFFYQSNSGTQTLFMWQIDPSNGSFTSGPFAVASMFSFSGLAVVQTSLGHFLYAGDQSSGSIFVWSIKDDGTLENQSVAATGFQGPYGLAVAKLTIPTPPLVVSLEKAKAWGVKFLFYKLKWDAFPGADSYRVFRNEVFLSSTHHRDYADTNFDPALEYTYQVKAYSSSGNEIGIVGQSTVGSQ